MCAWATSSPFVLERPSRSMESSSRAGRAWMNRCSQASLCPLREGPGETVVGATLNKFGLLKFEATKVGKETAPRSDHPPRRGSTGQQSAHPETGRPDLGLLRACCHRHSPDHSVGLVSVRSHASRRRCRALHKIADPHGGRSGHCMSMRDGPGNAHSSNGGNGKRGTNGRPPEVGGGS